MSKSLPFLPEAAPASPKDGLRHPRSAATRSTTHADEMDHHDQQLLAACLAGNKQAWSALIDRYERLIYSIPLRYGLSTSEAEEIFQEVCLVLLEKLEQVRSVDSLASWIGTTTRRACWKVMGRRDAAGSEEADRVLEQQLTVDSTPDELVAEWEAQQALRAALATLDERSRTLLERLYFTVPTPSYETLAREMDVPIGSIGPTRARSLQKLRRALEARSYSGR